MMQDKEILDLDKEEKEKYENSVKIFSEVFSETAIINLIIEYYYVFPLMELITRLDAWLPRRESAAHDYFKKLIKAILNAHKTVPIELNRFYAHTETKTENPPVWLEEIVTVGVCETDASYQGGIQGRNVHNVFPMNNNMYDLQKYLADIRFFEQQDIFDDVIPLLKALILATPEAKEHKLNETQTAMLLEYLDISIDFLKSPRILLYYMQIELYKKHLGLQPLIFYISVKDDTLSLVTMQRNVEIRKFISEFTRYENEKKEYDDHEYKTQASLAADLYSQLTELRKRYSEAFEILEGADKQRIYPNVTFILSETLKKITERKSITSNWSLDNPDSKTYMPDNKFQIVAIKNFIKLMGGVLVAWYVQGHVSTKPFDLSSFFQNLPGEEESDSAVDKFVIGLHQLSELGYQYTLIPISRSLLPKEIKLPGLTCKSPMSERKAAREALNNYLIGKGSEEKFPVKYIRVCLEEDKLTVYVETTAEQAVFTLNKFIYPYITIHLSPLSIHHCTEKFKEKLNLKSWEKYQHSDRLELIKIFMLTLFEWIGYVGQKIDTLEVDDNKLHYGYRVKLKTQGNEKIRYELLKRQAEGKKSNPAEYGVYRVLNKITSNQGIHSPITDSQKTLSEFVKKFPEDFDTHLADSRNSEHALSLDVEFLKTCEDKLKEIFGWRLLSLKDSVQESLNWIQKFQPSIIEVLTKSSTGDIDICLHDLFDTNRTPISFERFKKVVNSYRLFLKNKKGELLFPTEKFWGEAERAGKSFLDLSIFQEKGLGLIYILPIGLIQIVLSYCCIEAEKIIEFPWSNSIEYDQITYNLIVESKSNQQIGSPIKKPLVEELVAFITQFLVSPNNQVFYNLQDHGSFLMVTTALNTFTDQTLKSNSDLSGRDPCEIVIDFFTREKTLHLNSKEAAKLPPGITFFQRALDRPERLVQDGHFSKVHHEFNIARCLVESMLLPQIGLGS